MSFFKQSISVLFILGYFSLELNGQSSTSTIDSLKNVLQKQQEDSNKVNSLLEISGYYIGINDFTAALNHANLALTVSRKINFKKGEGNSFLKIGWVNYRLNNYGEAEKNDSLALNCFKEINSREDIARAYIELGWVGSYGNNWPQAIRNTLQAIKIFEELGNKKEVAAGHFWVGFVYYWNADYDPAYTSLTLALKKYEEIGHDGHNGECYIYIANIYKIKGKYKEALDLDSIGLKMAVAKNDRQMAANAYFSMGDIIAEQVDHAPISGKTLQELNSLTKASELYHEALNNFRAAGDPGGIGDCYGRISEINLRLRRIPEAQRYADSALSLAREVRFKDNLKTAYLVMARVDSAKGNFKSAFESYKTYILFRDSLNNEETVKKITEVQMQYEFDKKETAAKIEQLKKDSEQKRIKIGQWRVIVSLGSLIIVFLLIMFLQWRNSKQKKQANLLLKQQKEKIESTLTELKATQSQLIQSEKMASLGELTAGIAHEIQNPLNFVNNFSEVNKELVDELKTELATGNVQLANEIADDIKANEEKINHHGKRADAIVKGMLQHSRSSSGVKEPTDINALADEYLRLAYHGLRAKDKIFNASFKTDFDKNIKKINLIPQDIGRVILNLVNNAFYAVSEKQKQNISGYEPTVTVRSKKVQEKVELRVIDNGNGIPQKVLDKIFQPFFTTKPTGQGTGLGLSLSYDIVKAHGGEIRVETEERAGSEFIIQLPF